MMKNEEAIWIADFITEMISLLDQNPGMIIELSERNACWVQILPEITDDLELNKFRVLIPLIQRPDMTEEEIKTILPLPPGTAFPVSHTPGIFNLSIRKDIPFRAFGLFLQQIFLDIFNRNANEDLLLKIEFGF